MEPFNQDELNYDGFLPKRDSLQLFNKWFIKIIILFHFLSFMWEWMIHWMYHREARKEKERTGRREKGWRRKEDSPRKSNSAQKRQFTAANWPSFQPIRVFLVSIIDDSAPSISPLPMSKCPNLRKHSMWLVWLYQDSRNTSTEVFSQSWPLNISKIFVLTKKSKSINCSGVVYCVSSLSSKWETYQKKPVRHYGLFAEVFVWPTYTIPCSPLFFMSLFEWIHSNSITLHVVSLFFCKEVYLLHVCSWFLSFLRLFVIFLYYSPTTRKIIIDKSDTTKQ